MGVYDRQAAQALKQIEAKGEPVKWNFATPVSMPDESKPWIVATGDPTSKDVSLLFTSNSSNSLARLIAGSNIESSKLKAIMPDYGFVPNVKDTVTRSDGTTVLQIDSVNPLAPNGQGIIWYLEFKK